MASRIDGGGGGGNGRWQDILSVSSSQMRNTKSLSGSLLLTLAKMRLPSIADCLFGCCLLSLRGIFEARQTPHLNARVDSSVRRRLRALQP